jgi:uncharacterized integral membrane protein (TIGR00698 family)
MPAHPLTVTDSDPTKHRFDELGRARLVVVPGLSLAAGIAALCWILGRLVPVVGGPVFGLVVGAAVRQLWLGDRVTSLDAGIKVASHQVLQIAIVVLGLELSITNVAKAGKSAFPVMIGTLAAALLIAVVGGRLIKVRGNLQLLVGVGTAICGASAIAAVSAVVDAAEEEVAYAVATIFSFNIVAVLAYPELGRWMGLSQHAFGLWVGTAVNDTSSVLATATVYGAPAAKYAVVVKLTRSLMIIPICLAVGIHSRRRVNAATGDGTSGCAPRLPWTRMVPPFLLGFIAASLLDTAGLVPTSWDKSLTSLTTFLVTVALSAIGLSLRFGSLRKAGLRPLALGGMLWLTVAGMSLALQAATGLL